MFELFTYIVHGSTAMTELFNVAYFLCLCHQLLAHWLTVVNFKVGRSSLTSIQFNFVRRYGVLW